MNWKEAKKLKVGAIVRNSWSTHTTARTGLVLAKEYEEGRKLEMSLRHWKESRYLLTISWFRTRNGPATINQISSWDVMVVEHITGEG